MDFKNLSYEKAVQLLADSKNFYLVKVDSNSNYVYMNDHFISRHSSFYDHTEIRSAALALHPDDYELSYITYKKCVAQPDQTFSATLRKLDGKGGYIITYWEYKALFGTDGNIDGVIGIGYDITAFESRAEHIRFLTQTLSDLAQQQSHDIRRPLANIMGLAEVLTVLGEENEQVRSVAEKLVQSCVDLDKEFDLFLIRDLSEQAR
jgi:signal transduction histidine kinase